MQESGFTVSATSAIITGVTEASDGNRNDAIYDIGKGVVTIGLVIFCPEGLLFWGIEMWIGDETRDEVEENQ